MHSYKLIAELQQIHVNEVLYQKYYDIIVKYLEDKEKYYDKICTRILYYDKNFNGLKFYILKKVSEMYYSYFKEISIEELEEFIIYLRAIKIEQLKKRYN